MKTILAVITLSLVALWVLAKDSAPPGKAFDKLMSSNSLKCQFGDGASAGWDSGQLEIEKNKWGSEPSIFDSIDIDTGTARLIGNAGSVTLQVVANATGLHFIEFTDVGNLSVTTIFSAVDASGKFIAVISRHVDMLGPLPSQYYGVCERWE